MQNTHFLTKANDLYAKGEKTIKGSFFGNLSRSKADRQDEAKELFLQAANCFKLAQDPDQALVCYEKCIECEESEIDAAPHFREAANCIKDKDMDKYI